jgi:multiple sugar transport system substrate-binding protein
MKTFFAATFVVLIALSIAAWRMIPPPPGGTRITLVWTTDQNPTREAQVGLFNKLNPDLYLTIDPNNRDQQKVIVQSIGGVGPDLFDTFGKQAIKDYVNAGIAWDLTDFLKERGIEPAKLIWPVAVGSCMFQDRVYGFPCNVNAGAIWYNKDIFDEAGVPYPKPGWSWADLISTAQKLTTKGPDGRPDKFGFYWEWVGWNGRNDLIYTFGGQVFSENGTRCLIDSPECVSALTLAQDLMYKYKVSPSPVQEAALTTQGGWGSGGITYLMSGRVAMAVGGRWWLNLIRKEKPDLNLGAVEMPYEKTSDVVGGARCTVVNANSPRREAAARFIAFLASPEYNRLVNDQADAIAPVISESFTDRFLHNPDWPKEDYNVVWRNVVKQARPDEVNDYLRGSELGPIQTQMDLIRANQKDPASALRDAAIDANERIRQNARNRPALRELYVKATGEQP